MEGEWMVLLSDAVDAPETRTRTLQAGKPSSKLAAALLALTLCLAAAAAVLVFNRQVEGSGQSGDTFEIRHTLREISNVRAAIHLEGEYNPDMNTSVEWKSMVDQSHSQGGFQLNNNEIVIPRNGLYFIYSQASFRVSCSSGDKDDATPNPMVHLSHTVQRWSDTYGYSDAKKSYVTILHSVRTACQKTSSSDPDQEGSWFSAVYMGAVFSLNKGDRLKTVMQEKMLPDLEDDPGKTFFGVFAL